MTAETKVGSFRREQPVGWNDVFLRCIRRRRRAGCEGGGGKLDPPLRGCPAESGGHAGDWASQPPSGALLTPHGPPLKRQQTDGRPPDHAHRERVERSIVIR